MLFADCLRIGSTPGDQTNLEKNPKKPRVTHKEIKLRRNVANILNRVPCYCLQTPLIKTAKTKMDVLPPPPNTTIWNILWVLGSFLHQDMHISLTRDSQFLLGVCVCVCAGIPEFSYAGAKWPFLIMTTYRKCTTTSYFNLIAISWSCSNREWPTKLD